VTNDNSELLGILNSGHRRGGNVLRTVGDDNEPRQFATYSPCAFALIGKLPDTLDDRSVVIELRRRLPDEPIQRFRLDRTEHQYLLARRAARWAGDNIEALRIADPDVGDLFNRVADNWRPLLAIADAAGGDWPKRARKAAAAIAARASEDTAGIELLSDIRDIFAERGVGAVLSKDVVDALVAKEGRRWAEWGKAAKPITQNGLARLLKNFRTGAGAPIAPVDVWTGSRALKGYNLSQFEDAFQRYLTLPPEHPPPHPRDRETAHGTGTSVTFPSARDDAVLADGKCWKPNNDRHSRGLAVGKGRAGEEEGSAGPKSDQLCDHCGGPPTPADPPHPWDCNDRPDGFLLHSRCEAAWHDAEP
jgi:Protein of unknown function (DUF3631)